MITESRTNKFCPYCGAELANIKISDIEKEKQCFNCGYTSKDEINTKEGY